MFGIIIFPPKLNWNWSDIASKLEGIAVPQRAALEVNDYLRAMYKRVTVPRLAIRARVKSRALACRALASVNLRLDCTVAIAKTFTIW